MLHELSDVRDFVNQISTPDAETRAAVGELFSPGAPVVVARAPGRLDVMGGIGDYSGSLVLQWPLACAALVAGQRTAEPGLDVVSLPAGDGAVLRRWTLRGGDWTALLCGSCEAARERFHARPEDAWAAYVAGVILVLARERGLALEGGLRLLVRSDVPEGKGISSSAALEVASMMAVLQLMHWQLDGGELARLCQQAENQVVGAPCGIMDQMTSALGRQHELLALVCQPAIVKGFIPLPPELAFWGIDSGIRHAVSGSDYTSVRTGTYMGYRIAADLAGLPVSRPNGNGHLEVDDPRWHGYLANIPPREFAREIEPRLPMEIEGAAFLQRYGGITDRVTRVDPARTYAIRRPTAHPVYENARAARFAELLTGSLDETVCRELGHLMGEAHASYSACGLGSSGTDRLVELAHEVGPAAGIYGAKITGGGSGGTVAILARADASESVAEVARRYAAETGSPPRVFAESSPGACRLEPIFLA